MNTEQITSRLDKLSTVSTLDLTRASENLRKALANFLHGRWSDWAERTKTIKDEVDAEIKFQDEYRKEPGYGKWN